MDNHIRIHMVLLIRLPLPAPLKMVNRIHIHMAGRNHRNVQSLRDSQNRHDGQIHHDGQNLRNHRDVSLNPELDCLDVQHVIFDTQALNACLYSFCLSSLFIGSHTKEYAGLGVDSWVNALYG